VGNGANGSGGGKSSKSAANEMNKRMGTTCFLMLKYGSDS